MIVSTDRYEFRVYHERLAQFKHWDNQAGDWENYWSKHTPQAVIKSYAKGKLGELEVLTRYLRIDMPILEAGCGAGGIVMALQRRGYAVEGIDFAENTVEQMRAILPELNIRVGDIYAIDAPDKYYGGYISIGVFEHNPDGPYAGLKEARRVLADDGVALISVPYLNPRREKWLKMLRSRNSAIDEKDFGFYQYYYSIQEFDGLLRQAGLRNIFTFPYAVYGGLTRDYHLGAWLLRKGFFSKRIKRLFFDWCDKAPMWARRRFAHMALFVCEAITA